MPQSEVAYLREQIELTCQSLNQALYGFSTVTQHRIIAHRYARLDEQHAALAQLVGETEATETLIKIYDQEVH